MKYYSIILAVLVGVNGYCCAGLPDSTGVQDRKTAVRKQITQEADQDDKKATKIMFLVYVILAGGLAYGMEKYMLNAQ